MITLRCDQPVMKVSMKIRIAGFPENAADSAASGFYRSLRFIGQDGFIK
jgi:hypothetical protein